MADKSQYGQSVGHQAETGNDADAFLRHVALPADGVFRAGEHVADMHFHTGHADPCQTVGQRQAGMSVRARVESHAVRMAGPVLPRLFQAVDEFSLVVGLKVVQFDRLLTRARGAEHVADHGERGIHAVIAVDFRLTPAQRAEIWTVEYQNFHRMLSFRKGTGTNIITKDENGNSTFRFEPGPIFANLVLADEINRATPKTQSALLEAMQEHTVTVMGVSRKMKEPFFVLATQNPIEQDGTYPLPEAQMDRFMFKLVVYNPSLEELKGIVSMTQKTMGEVANVACNAEQLLAMRETANQIPVADEVLTFAMTLISATHPDSECASEAAKKYVRLGSSPRGGQALISAAKVLALMNGRFNVSYSDVASLAFPVLRHRMKMNFEAIAERVSPDEGIRMILTEVC